MSRKSRKRKRNEKEEDSTYLQDVRDQIHEDLKTAAEKMKRNKSEKFSEDSLKKH